MSDGITGQLQPGRGPLERPDLAGIRGWLILPAIGFVLGPIVSVVTLYIAIGLFTDVARAGYGNLYTLHLLVDAGLLAFTIYAAVLFFGKRHNAPATCIALLLATTSSCAVLLLISLAADAAIFASENGKQLVGSGIGAAIWIPYFRSSKRVAATFVW